MVVYLIAPAGDMLFYVIFANVPLVSSIIQGQLNELEEVLEQPQTKLLAIKYRLLQYLQMHHKYNA